MIQKLQDYSIVISVILCILIRIIRWLIVQFFQPHFIVPHGLIQTTKKRVRQGVLISISTCLILIPLNITIPVQKLSLTLIVDSSQSMYSQDNNPSRITQTEDIINILSNKYPIKHCFTQTSWNHVKCPTTTTIPNSGSALGDLIGVATTIYSWFWTLYVVFTDGWINQGVSPEQVIGSTLQDHIIRVDILPWKKNIMISWQVIGVNTNEQWSSIWSLPHYFIVETHNQIHEVVSFIEKKLINDQQYYTINKRLWLWIIIATSWIITSHLFSTP